MKKLTLLLLAFALVFTLTACGKSEAAQAVDDMISSLEVVDETSEADIEEIEAAYAALSDKDKNAIENYAQLEQARSAFDMLKADKAINAINYIGSVTENSWNDIQNARQIYDALTENEQELVSNYSDLTSAEEQFISIKIAPVEELISQIPTFNSSSDTLPDGFIKAVESANEAYEELDEKLKEKVNNHSDLVSATTYLSDYRVNSLIAYIDENFSEIDFNSGTALTVATTAYDMLSDDDKARITNYDVLEAAQKEFENLLPLELVGYRLQRNIIGNPDFYLIAKNMSDKIIKEFSFTVFAFDSDGIPVPVYFGDYSTGLRYSNAVKPGESTSTNSYWNLYGTYSDMKQIVVVLRDVEFFDGGTWKNGNYGKLCAKYNQQLLEAGDENVLPIG